MQKHPHIGFLFYKFQSRKYPVFVENRVYQPGFDSGTHSHDFPQFWYCCEGSYFHRVGDEVFHCPKGSAVILPAGIPHNFWVPKDAPCRIFGLHLSYEVLLHTPLPRIRNTVANLFLPVFHRELGYSLPAYRMLDHSQQLQVEEALSWLSMLSFALEGMIKTHQIYEKLEGIFSTAAFRLPEDREKKAQDLIQTRLLPIWRVVAYLNVHYPEKITEETVLEQCAISRAGLYRYFKQIVGHTYSQYLQQLRVRRAYYYVKHTTYSFSYISDICGFFDIHHMSRLFTKYIGENPRARRKRLREYYEGVNSHL